MNHKVKELFNTLYSDEEKIQSPEEIEQGRIDWVKKPRGRTGGVRPNVFFHVPPINRLSISMLFLVYKSYRKKEFQEFIDNSFTQELMLKAIILDILNSYNMEQTVEWYAKNGVDLEIILHQVLSNIHDEKFKMQVEEKIERLIKIG